MQGGNALLDLAIEAKKNKCVEIFSTFASSLEFKFGKLGKIETRNRKSF